MRKLYRSLSIILFACSIIFPQKFHSRFKQYTISIPVIYVPGIMGSPLYDDINNNNLLTTDEKAWVGPQFITQSLWLADNGIDPIGNFNIKVAPLRNDTANTLRDELIDVPMDLFKGFFDNLEANGYLLDDYDDIHNEGENLFCFTYDWRKNNLTNAELLSTFIDSVLTWANTSQVNLIGHSMGGIVSKSCIKNFDNTRIKNMIFIGTPHLGAPEVLTVMLKGKLFEWINFINEAEWWIIRFLARNLPACYQLIPTSSYFDLSLNNGVSSGVEIYSQCFQIPDGSYLNYPELINYLRDYETCIFPVETLNDELLYASEIFKQSTDTVDFCDVNVFNIVGHNILTIGKNKINIGGFPTYCNSVEYSRNLNGDFTIPVRSAELINGQIFEYTYYVPNIPQEAMPGSQETLDILLGIFSDPPNYYFPQFATPPSSYSEVIPGVENEIEVSRSYYLSQNFPNPFNPYTTIVYSVPQTVLVTLKIYDVLGREIVTLVNEEKPAGSYEITFSPGDLPSAAYFYQLKTDFFIETKRMLLLK
ncbi:MAG: T9SS type A sorting domain-containing protein [bacterium]|nr:T9SS type A sorting domain-containing protein [bacterium]